ncbi:3-oxo-5-alpha-steroid 4-dehydrogenase-domain-containing protein [Coemansia mojavensis]|nr:3-oxo-5-alpha-steroid 4-dehydrogenase-domain-containing protein [Coemansia mojavensis]
MVLLLQSIYALLAAIALAFELVPWTRNAFVKYGRTRDANVDALRLRSTSLCAVLLTRFSSLTVSKNLFSHFYWIGAFSGWLVLLDVAIWLWSGHSTIFSPVSTLESWDLAGHTALGRRSSMVVGLLMYNIHVLLRLKETVCDQPVSSAQMHIGQYAVGMVFYIATPFAMVADAFSKPSWHPVSLWMLATSASLFVYASVHQWRCHHILFDLRRQKLQQTNVQHSNPRSYTLPRGDLFEYVSGPHYFCEILIYISLWIATGCQAQTVLWVLIWTAINLGITARESRTWYSKTFGADPVRKALIPFVW